MKTLINDTADVVFKRKSDNTLILTAEAQLAQITQAVTENKLKGGIGNKTISLIRSDKEITLKVKNALFDLNWLSMTQGVTVQSNGTATVYGREDGLVTTGSTTLTATITGTPVAGTTSVSVVDTKGNIATGTISSKIVTLPANVVGGFNVISGDKVSVVYQQTVTGNILSLDSKKFSEQFTVEYHTIEYDPSTNLVVADLYIQFDSCLPAGAFDMQLQNGTALSPEIDFTALVPSGATEVGRVIEIKRP